MQPEQELLQPALEWLDRLRNDRSAWSGVQFQPEDQAPHGRRDLNAKPRLLLAWALQHAFQSKDAPLLRFALEEEVKWREQDPWQGVGETLEILGAMTACLRDVGDVWLLARAKQANFDTGCGFDRCHLFAAGVEQTVAYVRSSDRADREAVLEVLLDEEGAPRCEDAEVEEWLESRPDQLPAGGGPRSRVWFERAMAVGRLDIASFLLDGWIEKEPKGSPGRHAYVYDLEALERWAEASALRKERFELLEDAFDRAGEAREIARLERLAEHAGEAGRWLVKVAALHSDHEEWRQVGLGRMYVEECFRCASALGAERGAEIFGIGDRFAQQTPRLPVVALEAAVEAAKMFKSPRLSHYKQKLARETRRIEKLTGKFK